MQAHRLSDLNPKAPKNEDGFHAGAVEPRYNPTEYQYQDKFGHVYTLDTLSREDLLQIACGGMEAIERIDVLIDQQTHLINLWRKDDELPESPV
ncbi:MAG: hypothetical protein RSD49_06825 [Hafnia sp.]